MRSPCPESTMPAPATTRQALAPGRYPDRPVPYALTPRAYAALLPEPCPLAACLCGSAPGPSCPAGEWACRQCGAGFFGTAPEDSRCAGCPGPAAGTSR